MIKNKIISLVLFLIIQTLFIKHVFGNHVFTLTCNFKGIPDDIVCNLIHGTNKIISTGIIKKGRLTLKGKVEIETDYYYLQILHPKTNNLSDPLLLINAKQKIICDINKWPQVILTGSLPHNEFLDFQTFWKKKSEMIYNINKKIVETRKLLAVTKRNKDTINFNTLSMSLNLLKDSGDKLVYNRDIELRSFIATHPNSLYTPGIIIGLPKSFSFLEKRAMYNELGIVSQNSFFGQQLDSILKKSEMRSKIIEGTIIPDFSLKLYDGTHKSIIEIAKGNKLTLIDFWATWCGPCRDQFPNLKMLFSQYGNLGFNIVGIALADKESEWRNVIKKEEINWSNGIDTNDYLYTMFDVASIPAAMLIDQGGKIISFFCRGSEIKSFGPSLEANDLSQFLNAYLKTNR